MDVFWQDLRYALKLLLKAPAVSLVAVLSLALGIGANTAIFGVINALMLRSLPVCDPQQLVTISPIDPGHPDHAGGISLAMFDEIQRHATVFSNMFVWTGGGMRNIAANGAHFAGTVDGASGDYFAALGVRPVLGRVLISTDVPLHGKPSAQVAVLSYGCWQERFGGDPHVLGKTMRVDDVPVTVVGVAPPDFHGLIIDNSTIATIPIGYSHRPLKYRESMWYSFFGRLKPGVGISQARAQMEVLWPGVLKSSVPDTWRGAQRSAFLSLRPKVEPAAHGNSYMRHELEKPLAILMPVVGAVLLIACVNLANLLLARASARRHEFAVRAAMGAGRWALIRILLLESLLLSCTGAAVGLLMAGRAARFLLAGFWTGYVPLVLDPSPDARVLAFTAVLAVLTGLLFGIVPAWQMSRSDPANALGQNSRTMGGRTGRLSRVLIAAQVSLSLVLLVGAALFVRSLRNFRNVNLGYRTDHLLLVQLFPQPGREKITDRLAYYHELATRLSELPGVESVTFSHMGPASRYEYKEPASAGTAAPAENAVEEWAGPGLFQTMGMHVLAGRGFTWRDDEHAPRVAVISQSLARALFPNQDPIGRAINVGAEPEHQGLRIIGVVNSASFWKLDSPNPPAVYFALMQEPRYNEAMAVIRTRVEPLSLAHAAEHTLESLGHHYSLRTETLEQRTDEVLVLQRMVAVLASGFSLLALLLASIGLYGVMSYAVSRRTAEIGVRMALGALRSDVLRMILREVLVLVGIGIAIALPIAFVCGKLISGTLFAVSAADPITFLIAGCILIATAGIAGFLPARRASRVDPMVALRHE